MNLILADTSVWAREAQASIACLISAAIYANLLATIAPISLELLRAARDVADLRLQAARYDALRQIEITPAIGRRARAVQAALALRGYHRGPSPTDLLAAAAAEATAAELWHCDRHFELIAAVTGQRVRRLGR